MKLVKTISVLALTMGLTGVAHADGYETDTDARTAAQTTTTKRQVNYQCQGGKTLRVVYGFNRQEIPTYAQATLNGKTRFMPYNMRLSDNVTTHFGDDNNFNLGTSVLTISNYHSNSISTVASPSGTILFKSCTPRSVKRI